MQSITKSAALLKALSAEFGTDEFTIGGWFGSGTIGIAAPPAGDVFDPFNKPPNRITAANRAFKVLKRQGKVQVSRTFGRCNVPVFIVTQ